MDFGLIAQRADDLEVQDLAQELKAQNITYVFFSTCQVNIKTTRPWFSLGDGMILDDLDQRGIVDSSGNKLTAADIYDLEEVKEWSKYLTLSLIYKSVQGEVDDIYGIKSKGYMDMADRQRQRATIRLDLNQDGTVDSRPDLMSGRLVRR